MQLMKCKFGELLKRHRFKLVSMFISNKYFLIIHICAPLDGSLRFN